MNTKSSPLNMLRGNIAFKLWGAMMILAGIGVVFLWVVQIALFEPNYVDASMTTLIDSAEPLAEELSTEDAAGVAAMLRGFSKSISAKVFLVDTDGEVLVSYISGKAGGDADSDEVRKEAQYIIRDLAKVLDGMTSKRTHSTAQYNTSLVVGVPATYLGNPAALFVHQSLAAMQTLQQLNRNQLLMLSIVMALVASVTSVLLTRSFTRPIHRIENAVKRMADGELNAAPNVARADELGRLSRSVEELGVALQRVDVLRKEVIANVSHELSAPLSLIQGYSELIRDIHGDDPALRNQDIDLVLREATRLSQMVDDIMDYSKFQSGYGKLNIEPTNLVDLVSGEVAVVRHAAMKHRITIALSGDEGPIWAHIDPLKMSQVIRNLLNNAVNHTADELTISVAITRDNEAVQVSIRNPGRPIPEADREVIWERYQRIQHQGGRREGTGIGLSIVRTILGAHGMEYGVESGAGDNTFWFSIQTVTTVTEIGDPMR